MSFPPLCGRIINMVMTWVFSCERSIINNNSGCLRPSRILYKKFDKCFLYKYIQHERILQKPVCCVFSSICLVHNALYSLQYICCGLYTAFFLGSYTISCYNRKPYMRYNIDNCSTHSEYVWCCYHRIGRILGKANDYVCACPSTKRLRLIPSLRATTIGSAHKFSVM